MTEYGRPQQEVHRGGEKAEKYVKWVPEIGKGLSWIAKAFSTGSELEEGEQRYVTDLAEETLRQALKKKEECKCHPNSNNCR